MHERVGYPSAFMHIQGRIMTINTYPKLRYQEFHEQRVRSTAKASLLDEVVDQMLTEPIAPRLARWLDDSGQLVFEPNARSSTIRLPDDSMMVSLCYFLTTTNKGDAAQNLYGVRSA